MIGTTHQTKLLQGPVMEPLTLQQVKDHLKIDGTNEDPYLTGLAITARISLERYLNRVLITQRYTAFYNRWHGQMEIPFPPLQSIDQVRYYDGTGELQVLDEDGFYWIVDSTDPARIVRKFDSVYPELQDGRPASILIDFTCGYGDPEDVPEDLKHAMKLIITDYYENRGSIVIGQVNKIPSHIIALAHSYKIYLF